MPGTTRLSHNPEIGDQILTPRGLERITRYDLARDRVWTSEGIDYDISDLRLPEIPLSRDPASVEAWLAEEHIVLVRQYHEQCLCLCGAAESTFGSSRGCEWLVTERGSSRIMVHEATPRCTCGEGHGCCAIAL